MRTFGLHSILNLAFHTGFLICGAGERKHQNIFQRAKTYLKTSQIFFPTPKIASLNAFDLFL